MSRQTGLGPGRPLPGYTLCDILMSLRLPALAGNSTRQQLPTLGSTAPQFNVHQCSPHPETLLGCATARTYSPASGQQTVPTQPIIFQSVLGPMHKSITG